MENLGDDEVGQILERVTRDIDRKSCSRVCSQWRRVEGSIRTRLRVLQPQFLHAFLPRYGTLLILEAGRRISDFDLGLIAETCPALQVLDLNLRQHENYFEAFEDSNNADMVSDEGIRAIAIGCRDLRTVCLRRRGGLGNLGLTALISSCPNLTRLDLGFCRRITDDTVEALGVSGSLETLILQGCKWITDRGLASLAAGSAARTLKKLDLCECDRITDSGVCLLQRLSRLQVLNLAECGPRVTDTGGVALGAISSLENVNLSRLINVSDLSLLAIAENCKNLKEVNITGCESVTGDGIRAFFQHKSLEVMILDACYNVYAEDIEQTVLECRTLEYLGLDRELRLWIPDDLLKRIESHCHIEWL